MDSMWIDSMWTDLLRAEAGWMNGYGWSVIELVFCLKVSVL